MKTLRECSKYRKNIGNSPVFLNVSSLKTFCHIWRFVLISFVSVDVLSIYVLSHYALCLFRRSVHIRFVTLYILFLYLLSLYILSFRFLSLYVLSLNHRITFKHCIILMKNYLVTKIVLVRPASICKWEAETISIMSPTTLCDICLLRYLDITLITVIIRHQSSVSVVICLVWK